MIRDFIGRIISRFKPKFNMEDVSVLATKRPATTALESPDVKRAKPPKRKKMAVMSMYSGKGYYGVQINPGFPTIEEELCKALVKTELIGQEHSDDMKLMWFQRASRTDKGVSAADIEEPVTKLNEELPPTIRIVDITKATKSFDAKNHCSHRTYEYVTPTFAFAPIDQQTNEAYRITDDVISNINETLKLMLGTHNFHNFTSRKKYNEKSANRYMMLLEAGKPFEKDGIELIVITVRGASFMMHQIRKMIGLTMAVVRGMASKETIELCWGPDKVDIPKAPGLGLLLDKLHYDAYNKKFGRDGMHSAIDWSKHEGVIREFKMNVIYSNIIATEIADKSMLNWLETLSYHSFQTYTDSIEGNGYAERRDQRLTRADSETQITEPASKTKTSNETSDSIETAIQTDDSAETPIQTGVTNEARKGHTVDNPLLQASCVAAEDSRVAAQQELSESTGTSNTCASAGHPP